MTVLDILRPQIKHRGELADELLRRAAGCFEAGSNWREAADCWLQAGDPTRAAPLLSRMNNPEQAASMLRAAAHYQEALAMYSAWLNRLLPGDRVSLVKAKLGIAACLKLTGSDEVTARKTYREARVIAEAEDR